MNRVLNVILFDQTSAAHSEGKSSAESLVRFYIVPIITRYPHCIIHIIEIEIVLKKFKNVL